VIGRRHLLNSPGALALVGPLLAGKAWGAILMRAVADGQHARIKVRPLPMQTARLGPSPSADTVETNRKILLALNLTGSSTTFM
jgi:hypothetical protein